MTRALGSLLYLTHDEVRHLADHVLAAEPSAGRLAGRVVGVLPFGPTALTPAAWIAAAGRLGAGVIRRDDLDGAQLDEFEVCREAARWADILVTSHPLTGFAQAAAELTGRPVVNAGEGGGEDPCAGISLLAAAFEGVPRRGSARQALRAAVCGDLRDSRSARALLSGLAALGAMVLLVPAQGRELPDDQLQRVARRMGRQPHRFEAHTMSSLLDMVDTVLLARDEAPQLPLFREIGVPPDEAARRARREVEDLDVLFVAQSGGSPDRLVREPFRRGRSGALPEGAESPTAPRALEAALLFCAEGEPATGADTDAPREPARYRSGLGIVCRGETCVAARRPDRVTPDFLLVGRRPYALECQYCGTGTTAGWAASKLEGRFHPARSAYVRHILDANLVLFGSRVDALAAGFEPARRRSAGAEDEEEPA